MTELVGILNVTPDSVSDGGLYYDPAAAIAHAEQMFADGAAFVDVGGESTRPGAEPVSPEEEWHRIGAVLGALTRMYPGKISVDTYHPEIAEKALALDPEVIINDVTGMNNPEMADVVVRHGARVIISHLPPDLTIQQAHAEKPVYSMMQVANELNEKVDQLVERGLPKEKIILDPGIGFGKAVELNPRLLEFGDQMPGLPVMIGYSRKSFLHKDKAARESLKLNLKAGKVAVLHNAAYLRVHDVAGHRRLVQ